MAFSVTAWTTLVAIVAVGVVVTSVFLIKTSNDNLDASERALRSTQARKIVHDTAQMAIPFVYKLDETVNVENAETYAHRRVYRRILGSADDAVDLTSLITQTMLAAGDTAQTILETATGSTGFDASTVLYGFLW